MMTVMKMVMMKVMMKGKKMDETGETKRIT